MIRTLLCTFALGLSVSVATAQHHHMPAQHHMPYAQIKDRPIKSLSEQQIADLRAGRGMGLALPAELNGYPGPMHVLELAEPMQLSAEQRQKTAGLFERMKSEAIAIGEKLIENEAALERLFASREITPASLGRMTQDIAQLQGKLRETHLKYHLAMMELLTPEQTERYRALRGYVPASGSQHQQHQHHRRHH